MSEQIKDDIEETIETPEGEQEETTEGEGEKEDEAKAEIEKLRKENAELQDKNKKLYARAKSGNSNKADGLAVDAVLELQSEGFSPKDILEFKKEAQDMGVSIDTLVKNKRFIAGFKAEKDADKAKDNATNATPSGSSRSFFASDSKKEFKDMNKQEKEAIFKLKMESLRRK